MVTMMTVKDWTQSMVVPFPCCTLCDLTGLVHHPPARSTWQHPNVQIERQALEEAHACVTIDHNCMCQMINKTTVIIRDQLFVN